jgi:hypothetical protein
MELDAHILPDLHANANAGTRDRERCDVRISDSSIAFRDVAPAGDARGSGCVCSRAVHINLLQHLYGGFISRETAN